MEAALRQYKDIRNINPSYRDTADQIRRMKEPLERAGVQILGFAMIGESQEP